MPFTMTLPRINKRKTQGNFTSYELEPLQPGYGMTIAHTLMRILTRSLPGAAVTALRIEGAGHTDQAIPHVKEDMAEVILNVKQVRIRCLTNEPVVLRLEASGEREVTAADILTPKSVEIVNPELHLATLDHEQAHLVVDLLVEMGKGYQPAEEKANLLPEMIPIDAIYTPIRKVTYHIDHTRVGKMVNFDKILLEIETDGTLTPDDAFRQSGTILLHTFQALTRPHAVTSEPRKPAQSNTWIPQEIYDLPLEQLGLSVRSYNALKRHGHMTKVGHILIQDEEGLRGIRTVGDKILTNIQDRLLVTGCLPQHDYLR